jgi:transcriptional regulator with XRE-family HTH domain
MSLKDWEKKVLAAPGATERVREVEEKLRLAAGLTALREQAGLSQRDLAKRIGVSQPRIAAIERSSNVTIDILEQYVAALGAQLEVSVIRGRRRTPLVRGRAEPLRTATRAAKAAQPKARAAKKAAQAADAMPSKAKSASRKIKVA